MTLISRLQHKIKITVIILIGVHLRHLFLGNVKYNLVNNKHNFTNFSRYNCIIKKKIKLQIHVYAI